MELISEDVLMVLFNQPIKSLHVLTSYTLETTGNSDNYVNHLNSNHCVDNIIPSNRI